MGRLVLVGLLASGTAGAQDFQVNSYTLGAQVSPDVTRIAGGEFVVVWTSSGSPGPDTFMSSEGRRFDAGGTPLDDQFQINTYAAGYQISPRAAMDDAGNFVVVWQDHSQEGNGGLFAQRFAAGGGTLGSEFHVNTYTTGFQRRQEIARAPGGDFVVVWESDGSYGSDSSGYSVQGQRFAANGLPLGPEFQVNTYTTAGQSWPGVAVAGSGDFVVVWHSSGSGGSDDSLRSVQGQRFAANGLALGGEFQVNSYTSGDQSYPSIAMAPSGDFVVVWQSAGSAGSDTDAVSVQARRFAADATPLGADFQVNTYTTNAQGLPHVATDDAGNFVVVWQSYGGSVGDDNSNWSVAGRAFASIGTPVGAEFQINSYTTGAQALPRVGANAGGDFVVVWHSLGSSGTDNSSWSIQSSDVAQIGVVFADGFESGDSSRWSNSVPRPAR